MNADVSGKRIVRYFVSYAHADGRPPERLLARLKQELAACADYTFEQWRDTGILIGEKWHEQITLALETCDFGLLLLSPSFLGSRYITEHELSVFVTGAKPCLPVALCSIDFDNQDLKGIDALQIFRFTPPRAVQAKTFIDCTSDLHQREFAHGLFREIVNRLATLLKNTNETPRTGSVVVSRDENASYRAHVYKYYRHLQLDALAGEQRVYRDVELQHVFVPQDARNCKGWLPEATEAAEYLSVNDPNKADLRLAALQEHKRFREAPPVGVLELLDDDTSLHRVILGPPGAGKTSLALIRLLMWADNPTSRRLPVFIELRRFNRSPHRDFLEYLGKDEHLLFRFAGDSLRSLLETGKVELLFDGLDEIFEAVRREETARQIARYATDFPRTPILVTSRLVGYPSKTLSEGGFAHWLLAEFDEKKTATFIQDWIEHAIRHPGDRPMVQARLQDALRGPAIRELAGNPLLLTLMAVLARKSDLPRDLGSLYVRAADLLLEQWETHRMLAADVELGTVVIDQKDKRDLLRGLAWTMQTGQYGLRGNVISETHLREEMDKALRQRVRDDGLRRKAISLLIKQLTERNYILCHLGGAHFAFVHRGFLEFFASEYLLHIISTKPDTAMVEIGRIFQEHAEEDAWTEVLVLAATRFEASVADKLLSPLVGEADAEAVGTAVALNRPHPFTLACKVLSRARESASLRVTTERARTRLNEWLEAYPQSFSGDHWVSLLAQSMTDDVSRQIVHRVAQRKDSSFAQSAAIRCLAQFFPHPETRAFFVDLILREQKALEKVIDWFPAAERPLLIAAVAQVPGDAPARAQAISLVVTSLEETDAQRILTEIALRNEDSFARKLAAENLVRHFLDRDIRQTLTEIALKESAIRRFAVDTLLQQFRGDPENRQLLEALARGDRTYNTRAIAALANEFPDPQTGAFLMNFAHTTTDEHSRKKALQALARIFCHPETRELLKMAVLKGQTNLSQVMEWLPAAERAPLVVAVAEADGDALPRAEAIDFLLPLIPAEKARSIVTKILERDEDTPAQARAIDLLAQNFCDDQTKRVLAQRIIKSKDSSVRSHALKAVVKYFRDRETRQLLNKLAREDMGSAGIFAIEALSTHFQDFETRELLMEVVRGEDRPRAQEAALNSLANSFPDKQTLGLFFELALGGGGNSIQDIVLSVLPYCFGNQNTRMLLTQLISTAAIPDVRCQALAALVISDTSSRVADLLRTVAQTAQGRQTIVGAYGIVKKVKAATDRTLHLWSKALSDAEKLLFLAA